MAPKPRMVDAHVAIAAVAATVLINRRSDIKHITGLLAPNGGQTRKMLVGTTGIFVFEQVVRKALEKGGVKLPSSLVSMIVAFILLKGYEGWQGKEKADKLADYFGPAVDHLGKWMPLYLAPPLVVLPNALNEVQGASMWAKLGGVHVAGWILSLLTTAAIAKAAQGSRTPVGPNPSSRNPKEEEGEGEAGEEGGQQGGQSPGAPGAAGVVGAATVVAVAATGEEGREGEGGEKEDAGEVGKRKVKTKEQKAEEMRKAWAVITAASFILAPTAARSGPATFSTTILALLHANALPSNIKKVLHPLVVCSLAAGVVAFGMGKAQGVPLRQALTGYFTKKGMLRGGSGDVFFGFLNASCCALGFRMFYNRDVLSRNLVPLLAATVWSSMTSLFATTAATGAAGLPPKLGMTLAQRSVMSSLGIPAATILGGNPALAVASILVTGVYGASVGQSILDAVGITKDEVVPRGIAMGASAHSIGTASLMEHEAEAAAVASVALCLAGVFHTVVCSVPPAQVLLRMLAGTGGGAQSVVA